MPIQNKPAIFLSYSFDKVAPKWSSVSDFQVAQWFEKLIKNHGFQVLSGRNVQSRPLSDKIFETVDQSKAVIAIFTGKYPIDSASDRFLPSQWVLCECAYAQGRFRDSEFIVAGFREKGVSPGDLASVTTKGMEIPQFERDYLERDKETFVAYLKDLEGRLLYGPTGQKTLIDTQQPFVQTRLHKIVLIYRNGYCTTQNIVELSIKNPEVFNSDYKGQVVHHIWNFKTDFPPLETMMSSAIYHRKVEPFFYAKADYVGNKKLGTPLRIEVQQHTKKGVYFKSTFLNQNGQPLAFKHHDTIKYQYAWGLPDVFSVNEEDLKPIEGEDINADTYCIQEAEASRGIIDDFTLELRFERQSRGTERGELFSKNPVFQTGHQAGPLIIWGNSRTFPKINDTSTDLDMWYEIYRLNIPNFDGRIRVVWRPSSRKYNL